ncbi:MAG TPA: HEAT repeat domain-containing protein [Myxococcales bacterium]
MGLLDFLSRDPAVKAKRLQKAVTEKYGPPENRQKAIDQLLDMGTADSLAALMMRFTVNAEPSITDAEEKDYTYNAILRFEEEAIEPVKGFLRKSDVATSWALKLLAKLLPEAEVVGLCVELLTKLGPEYTRDPEKKNVLLNTLGDLKDERITPSLMPFLEDPSDEVRIAAASALAKQKDERSREAVLKAFVDSSDRARVKAVLADTLLQTGFGVQGYREKIEAGLPEGYFVDKAGVVKKRE